MSPTEKEKKIGPVEDDQAEEQQDADAKSDGEEVPDDDGGPAGTKKPRKRKRGPKAKIAQAMNNVLAKKDPTIPAELVNMVKDAVNAQGGVAQDDEADMALVGPGVASSSRAAASGQKKLISEEEARKALEIIKAVDFLQGKSGIGGKNKKDLGEFKFWKTQPVPQIGEARPDHDGPIEPSVPREQVRQDPYPLPPQLVWSPIDMEDPEQTREVYELLSQNYVEDTDASFRFKYSAEFLEWALKPPGYHKEWHIGIRGVPKNKLVAFISGVPIKLKVRENVFDASEINYLCVHKKLRSKRLTPVLIKEVTRQCHLKGVFQAIYTGGVFLPTPVSTCRYFHRTLNIPKLVDVNFTFVPRNSTLARMIKLSALPQTTSIPGLREMEENDIEAVEALFNQYLTRFKMIPVYSTAELKHQFYSGRGYGEVGGAGQPGRRDRQVVWTYVVEDPQSKKITDFFSFYSLPSTIMKSTKHALLEAAYLFYYATDVAFEANAESSGALAKRLQALIGDLLIVARNAKFDVVNAMTLMDNDIVLKDLKFGPGDGFLNFYLYNWQTLPLEGNAALSEEEGGGQGVGRGVGVVML